MGCGETGRTYVVKINQRSTLSVLGSSELRYGTMQE